MEDLKRVRVLRISEVLSSYSNPILAMINENVDFTYAYTDKKEVNDTSYKTMKLDCIRIGGAIYIKNLRRLANQYDVIIFGTHLRILNTKFLFYLPRKFKIITWSIGMYINYNRKFDFEKLPDWKDKYTIWLHEKSDACIFYTQAPIEYWKKHWHIHPEKYFVAHNTVKVASFEKLPNFKERKNLLFIGTLYAQKGIDELIDAYKIAKMKKATLPPLIIIGKGPEEDKIKQRIKDDGLDGVITLAGPVYDEEKLKEYFFSSLLCISPKQAGLSVQRSLGYGTPFVTRPDAITGGERFDIIDGKTGFFYNTVEELADIIASSNEQPAKMELMCNNALKYYRENASPEIMVQGVVDAIKYVLNTRK